MGNSENIRWRLHAALLSTALLLACGDSDGGDGAGGNNPSGIGNDCAGDEDCETGECYLGPGGGYCTSECQSEGSEAQCPADTVCKPIQGGPARCLLICGSNSACDGAGDCGDSFCPSGSSCVSVSETNHEACEPSPN